MNRKQHIAWSDVLDLRVVRRLGLLIKRRWNLGVGFLNTEGAPVECAEANGLALRRPVCDLLRTDLERPAVCGEAGETVFCQLRRDLPGRLAGPLSTIFTCPAGLREVVAPIRIDDELQGVVVGGGYLPAESGSLQRTLQAIATLGGDVPSLESSIDSTPRLGQADEALLQEIVELIAEEISGFQRDSSSFERRKPIQERNTRYSYKDIISESRLMQELYLLLDKVIDSDSTVLIQGENGTGKELFAKAIHFNSSRKERRFIVQNCSAFNDNLLDSELFGHKKGSFTGAISDKQGLFEVADGSTFFLDEIGDMSPSLQVKLLRVLQEGTFIPVGDTMPKQVDVRIIAATNRDIKRMVERGEFREDLYYRINVINIHVPPLRERKEDIQILIDFFLHQQAKGNRHRLRKLSKACISRLMEYSWPGNIRELENEIERLVVLTGEDQLIGEELLSTRIRQQNLPSEGTPPRGPNCLPDAVRDLERNMIYEVLKRSHWNKTRAAAELHISRRNLIRKVNKYHLDQRRER